MENKGLCSHNPGAVVVHYSEGSPVVRKKWLSKQSSFSSYLQGGGFSLRCSGTPKGVKRMGLGSPGPVDLKDQLNEPQ